MGDWVLSYNCDALLQKVVGEILKKKGFDFTLHGADSLQLHTELDESGVTALRQELKEYGITLSDKNTVDLVERIKSVLKKSVDNKVFRTKKISALLADELGYSYAYLSNFFTKATFTSIENFLILLKIEKAKELLLSGKMSLTEVADRLDYSSVAHLSGQFKKVTGLTPTVFRKIIAERK